MNGKYFSPRPWNNHRSYEKERWLSSQTDVDDVELSSEDDAERYSGSSDCFDEDESVEIARDYKSGTNVSIGVEAELSFIKSDNKPKSPIRQHLQSTFRQDDIIKTPPKQFPVSPIKTGATKKKILFNYSQKVLTHVSAGEDGHSTLSSPYKGLNNTPLHARKLLRRISSNNGLGPRTAYPKRRRRSVSRLAGIPSDISMATKSPVQINITNRNRLSKPRDQNRLVSTPTSDIMRNGAPETADKVKLSPIFNLNPLFGEEAINEQSTVNSREIVADNFSDSESEDELHKVLNLMERANKRLRTESPRTYLKNSTCHVDRVVFKKFFLPQDYDEKSKSTDEKSE